MACLLFSVVVVSPTGTILSLWVFIAHLLPKHTCNRNSETPTQNEKVRYLSPQNYS
jgi:hypothetical protein